MIFSPHGVIQSVSPLLPKVSSTYDMLPKNHMKYPLHQLYNFPVRGYIAIVAVLFQNLHLNQTYSENLFLIFWELRCHSSINIWIVTFSLQLLQNNQEIYELHITHVGIILNLFLKTRISLCLKGTMMLTIIILTKVFTRGRKQKQYIFSIFNMNLQTGH